jgi:hypothetical protein
MISSYRKKQCFKFCRNLISAAILSITVLLQTINQTTFSHDLSSYIAPIHALLENGVGPYKDYWDIKPPFLYIILSAFSYFFGMTLASFYLTYFFILFMFFLTFQYFLGLMKVKSIFIFLLLLIGMVLSDFFLSMFFPSEIIGVTLILSALYLLDKNNYSQLFIPFLLMNIAGQTKEIYVFVPLFISVYLVFHGIKFIKIFSAYIASFLFVALIAIMFLYKTQALEEYLTVLNYKSDVFKIDFMVNFIKLPVIFLFTYIQHYTFFGIFTLLFLVLLIIFLSIKNKWTGVTYEQVKLKLSELRNFISISVINLTVFISILLGLLWQGSGFVEHYALALIPFILLLIVRFFRSALIKNRFLNLFICFLMFSPNYNTILTTTQQMFSNIQESKRLIALINSEENARDLVFPIPRCLQVAYGWSAGIYYYYNKTVPCSKYFLSTLTIRDTKLANNFKKDILLNPPSNIIYNTAGAGLDVSLYESTVFPYKIIIDNCYKPTLKENLFIEKYSDQFSMQVCIKKYVT